MNTLQSLLAIVFISLASTQAIAGPADVPADQAHPAQLQKDKVPNSTENGNYLEPQPTENTDVKQTDKHHTKDGKNKPKGKNVTEQPKDGGVDVSPKK